MRAGMLFRADGGVTHSRRVTVSSHGSNHRAWTTRKKPTTKGPWAQRRAALGRGCTIMTKRTYGLTMAAAFATVVIGGNAYAAGGKLFATIGLPAREPKP